MKIGILTQPLLNNYGGTLQNYALQVVLRKLGHDPITIDYIPKSSLFRYLLSCLKTIVYLFIPSKRRSFSAHPRRKKRNTHFYRFIKDNIILTKTVCNLSNSLIENYGLEAIVVGSDQVWRPKYNPHIKDMFLGFVKNSKIKKISYAASFGTDKWEFSDEQTVMLQPLIRKFAAISVREESAVKLCKQYIGIESIQVLDPTLLIEKTDYMKICSRVPKEEKSFIFAYILDMDNKKMELLDEIGKEWGIAIQCHSAEAEANLSIEEWIAKFRDASYIVTDSFHGTVFSILFGKPFRCLLNENRGSSRLDTLLRFYNNGTIEQKRKESIDFLKKTLINPAKA